MIIVFGSLFMDVCFPINAWPGRGDIIGAGPVTISCGGKGANQAVAAVRGGSKVHMIGMVGDDAFGKQLTARLRSEGVATSGVGYSQTLPTGVVGVIYEPDGVNTQIASSAANRDAHDDQVPDSIMKTGNYIMTGLCLPRAKIEGILNRARGTGCISVLNLSPIKSYNHEMAQLADIIMVNRDELMALAVQLGLDATTPEQALEVVGVKIQRDIVATLDKDGVIARQVSGEKFVLPAVNLGPVVDTNGAGDCFAGTFVSALDTGMDWHHALQRACAAAALSCQKVGAMDSYPYQADIDVVLNARMTSIQADSAA